MNIVLLLFYCLILIGLSLLGGWLPTLWKWTHIRIQLVMSLIAGFMLGIAFVQLLPHAFGIINDATIVGMTMLGGLLTMFFLIRIFDFHHHHFPDGDHGCDGTFLDGEESGEESEASPNGCKGDVLKDTSSLGSAPASAPKAADPMAADRTCDHDHGPADHSSSLACAHDHDHSQHQHLMQQNLGWLGLLFGLGLHSIMDGVALAASMQADVLHEAWLAGIGIFLAIALHKPLDAMSISSVMSVSGWDKQQQLWVNLVFALSCPLAAVAVYFGLDWLPDNSTAALGYALAFSAGSFLCISLGDLLPELHFHTHDRFKLSLALLVGIGMAVLFEFLPMHAH